MKEYKFHMLNVGQGLCTMLEGIKNDDSQYCAVFDCGTLEPGKIGLDSIVDIITGVSDEQRGIDGIVISHQDVDHWSMLLDIIFEALGAESKNVLCKQNELYIEQNSSTTIVCNKESVGDRIGYAFFEVSEKMEKSVEIKVDPQNRHLGFEVKFKVEKCERWGDFKFSLKVNERGEGGLSILLYDIGENKIINRTLEIKNMTSKEDVKAEVVKEIHDEGIESVINEDRVLRNDYHNFLTLLDQLCDSYASMNDKLSKETNYEEDIYIGPIWMGGDCWEIGYTRLYYLLRRLVDCGIVEAVNGYTKGGRLPEKPPHICGLVCMNEDTFIRNFRADEFSYDDDLLDINTGKTNWESLAIRHNATSLVVEFHTADGDRLLLPGDATVHVFSDLAEKLDSKTGYDTLLAAPHHGSGHTNFCVVDEEADEGQPFETLLTVLNDQRNGNLLGDCGVSALAKKFGHPSKRFIDTVIKYLSQNDDMHQICYVRDGDMTKTAVCENTKKHLYCTEQQYEEEVYWPYPDPDPDANRKKRGRLQGTKGAGAARRPLRSEFL